jgi:hypothetical protein
MGRHHRQDDDLDAILTGWDLGTAPTPRVPADLMICPRCASDQTVSHGAVAHCGRCGRQWQIGPVEVVQSPADARRALDAWASCRTLPKDPT